MSETTFYLTETLKKKMMEKPIISYIPDDGKDPNPAWDLLARSVWPSSTETETDREAFANRLMKSIHNESEIGCETVIILSRMAQLLMGRTWVNDWLKNHYFEMLRTPFRKYRRGKIGRFFDKFFQ